MCVCIYIHETCKMLAKSLKIKCTQIRSGGRQYLCCAQTDRFSTPARDDLTVSSRTRVLITVSKNTPDGKTKQICRWVASRDPSETPAAADHNHRNQRFQEFYVGRFTPSYFNAPYKPNLHTLTGMWTMQLQHSASGRHEAICFRANT